jgi:hypothetical protein
MYRGRVGLLKTGSPTHVCDCLASGVAYLLPLASAARDALSMLRIA